MKTLPGPVVSHVNDRTCTHYIGRGFPPFANVTNTHLGNPFIINVHGNRAEVLKLFESWARHNKGVLERIRALPANAVLGCWCKPQLCHGDIIAQLWREMHHVHA